MIIILKEISAPEFMIIYFSASFLLFFLRLFERLIRDRNQCSTFILLKIIEYLLKILKCNPKIELLFEINKSLTITFI